MSLKPYEDWISIFDDDLAKIWTSFLDKKELQKVSMVLLAVKREFQKVADELDQDLINLKQKLSQRNRLQTKEKFPLTLSNVSPSRSSSEQLKPKKDFDNLDKTVESPDLFYTQKQNSSSSETEKNTTVILSDEDTTKLESSPIIKRRRKVSKLKQNSNRIIPSLCFDLNNLGSVDINTRPTLNNAQNETPPTRKAKVSPQCLFKTPLPNPRISSDMDCSVIANTPEVELRKTKGNISKGSLLYMSKKKSSKKSNVTLTQMFSESSKTKVKGRSKTKKSAEESSNSDIKDCDINSYKDVTKMSISEMVNFINEDPDRKETEECVATKKPDISNKELETEVTDPFAKGLNEYLAKIHNIPGNAAPGPVVRGNARKELPSWSCKECEKFYMNQDLSIDEIQRLSKKCSKHRGITKPREDTVPGFWDITMTTQESQ